MNQTSSVMAKRILTALVWILALLFISLPVYQNWTQVPQAATNIEPASVDFKSYYAFSKLLHSHRPADIYVTQRVITTAKSLFADDALPNAKPPPLQVLPFALPLFYPISFMPPDLAPKAWDLVLVMCTVSAVSLLSCRARMTKLSCGFMLLLIGLSGPYHSLIRLGELAPVGLLLIACSLVCLDRKNYFFTALALIAAAVKPHWLLGLLAYLAGARKYRVLAWLALLILMLWLSSYLCFGTELYQTYAAQAKLFCAQPSIFSLAIAVSLTAQLCKVFPQAGYLAITPFSGATFACALLFLFWLGHRFRSTKDWLARGVISSFPIGITFSFYYTAYDLIFLAPSLMYLLNPAKAKISTIERMVLWIAMAGLTNPQYHFISNFEVTHPQFINPLYLATWAVCLIAIRVSMSENAESSPQAKHSDRKDAGQLASAIPV